MRSLARIVLACAVIGTAGLSVPADMVAQRRGPGPPPQREPARPRDHGRPYRPTARGSFVFIGGYFYDPFFGPYPWWSRGAYPYTYYPVYDNRAVVRVIATPKDAAVYVDGFYAGTVHDFNDWFQGLPVPPGGHEIVLYLDGYRTVRDRLYVAPGSTVKLHRTMQPLPPGVTSEPPLVAPPLPAPPPGTYMTPRTAAPAPPWPPAYAEP
jgi:hypothetical protein